MKRLPESVAGGCFIICGLAMLAAAYFCNVFFGMFITILAIGFLSSITADCMDDK